MENYKALISTLKTELNYMNQKWIPPIKLQSIVQRYLRKGMRQEKKTH